MLCLRLEGKLCLVMRIDECLLNGLYLEERQGIVDLLMARRPHASTLTHHEVL